MPEELDIDNRAEFDTFVFEQTNRCRMKENARAYTVSFTCNLQGKYTITENCRKFLNVEQTNLGSFIAKLDTERRTAKDLNYNQINQHVDRAQTNSDLDATLRTIKERSKLPLKTLAVIKELLNPSVESSESRPRREDVEYANRRVLEINAQRRNAARAEELRPVVAAANRATAIDRGIQRPSLDIYGWRFGGPMPGRGGTRRRMKNPSWKGYKLHGTKKTRRGTGHRTRRRNK